jgi:hypothetical protein
MQRTPLSIKTPAFSACSDDLQSHARCSRKANRVRSCRPIANAGREPVERTGREEVPFGLGVWSRRCLSEILGEQDVAGWMAHSGQNRCHTPPGLRATFAACRKHAKPYLIIEEGTTKPSDVVDWMATHHVEVLNVAGNRESKNPGLRVPIVAEKKTTNLVRGHGFTVFRLLETRLREADSRKRIREWLSRAGSRRNRVVSPQDVGTSRLPSFAR